MKFLADMGISPRTIAWLRAQGHEVLDLRELNMKRAPDDEILAKARGESCILLTLDLDFGYLLAISGEALPSVVIFRLDDQSSPSVNTRLAEVLAQCDRELNAGAIISVSEAAIRVRQLPIER